MTERDFFFWLQGFFELGDACAVDITMISVSWSECIKKHAALVRVTCKEKGLTPSGLLLSVETLADDPKALKRIVDAAFQHDIDKTLPPKHLDPAHRPDAVIRC
jgi:hypothetical protein